VAPESDALMYQNVMLILAFHAWVVF